MEAEFNNIVNDKETRYSFFYFSLFLQLFTNCMSILKLSTNNYITNIMIIDLDIIILDMICLNVDWLVLLQFKSIGYYYYQY